MRVGHPLVAHDRLELAAARSRGTATAGGRGSTRGRRSPRSPSPPRSAACRCRDGRCGASSAGRRDAGRTACDGGYRRADRAGGGVVGGRRRRTRTASAASSSGSAGASSGTCTAALGRPAVHAADPRDARRDRAAPQPHHVRRDRLGLARSSDDDDVVEVIELFRLSYERARVAAERARVTRQQLGEAVGADVPAGDDDADPAARATSPCSTRRSRPRRSARPRASAARTRSASPRRSARR